MKQKKRRLGAGAYALCATIAVLAMAILLNLAVSALPQRFTKLDMTREGLLALSEQTRQIVAGLDADVVLTLLATSGQEDETTAALLGRYASLSPRVRVETVDPSVNPAVIEPYRDAELSQNSVIVKSGDRSRFVPQSAIYAATYALDQSGYGYQQSVDFEGERALTAAIDAVTSDDLPILYATTGHGEMTLSESALKLLNNDNLTVETVNLLSLDAVPEDASCVFIGAPRTDITEDEARMLIDYLIGGGCVLLTTDVCDPADFQNLLQVTAAMNATLKPGIIVEGDASYTPYGYPYYLLPAPRSHAITDSLIRGGAFVILPLAQPIIPCDNDAATLTTILETSASAYLKADYGELVNAQTSADETGAFNVGVACEREDARLVWFSSANCFDDQNDAAVSGGNYNLLRNALNWLCARDSHIAITPKSMDEAALTPTAQQSALWSALLVFALPLLLLAVGGIWFYRRKRR